MYNRIILVGRVVAHPESNSTSTGKTVANFTIAVDRPFSPGPEKVADFFPIVAWNKLAETCTKYLDKGRLILVEGRLQTRTYENKDGIKVKVFEVVADNMRMLTSGNRDNDGGMSSRSSNSEYSDRGSVSNTSYAHNDADEGASFGDDLPF